MSNFQYHLPYCIYAVISRFSQSILYVGASAYVERRIKTHRSELLKKTHCNKGLIQHVERFGLDDLIFIEVLPLNKSACFVSIEKCIIEAVNPRHNIVRSKLRVSEKKNEGRWLDMAIEQLQKDLAA